MVSIIDSPDFLVTHNEISNMSFLKKIIFLFYGFFVSLIFKYTKNLFFTRCINLFLNKPVKIMYQDGYYCAKDELGVFRFTNKRVTRVLNGIDEHCKKLFEHYMLNLINFEGNDLIVDCGANVGEIPRHLLNNFKEKELKYIAFEPDPEIYKCLNENFKQNNFFSCNSALSNENAKKYFYLDSISADSSLEFSGQKEKIEIQTVTLDEFKFENIKVLKIDAEGHELEVLQGAKTTLPKIHYISVDFGLEKGLEKQSTLPGIVNFLIKNNFYMIEVNLNRNIGLFKNSLISNN